MSDDFARDITEVPIRFPTLQKVTQDGKQIIAGELPILDTQGIEWDRYQIEVHDRDRYPFRFPLLFETGGRIPRITDWHIYLDTGSCCVDITPSEIIHCKGGLRVIDFLKDFAIPYFANQTHRIKEGYYKNGEYSHGGKGYLEYYMPLLKTTQSGQAVQWLQSFCKGTFDRMIIFSKCFCGSGKKFGNCHKKAISTLQTIGPAEVWNHLTHINRYLRK